MKIIFKQKQMKNINNYHEMMENMMDNGIEQIMRNIIILLKRYERITKQLNIIFNIKMLSIFNQDLNRK